MTIKYSDFKLTQNAASAEPQNWRQIFAEVRPNSSHVSEPNVRPKFDFGPSLMYTCLIQISVCWRTSLCYLQTMHCLLFFVCFLHVRHFLSFASFIYEIVLCSNNKLTSLLIHVIVQFGSWQAICTGTSRREDKFYIWSSNVRRDIWQLETGWFWMGHSTACHSQQNGKPFWWIMQQDCV